MIRQTAQISAKRYEYQPNGTNISQRVLISAKRYEYLPNCAKYQPSGGNLYIGPLATPSVFVKICFIPPPVFVEMCFILGRVTAA